MNALAAFTEHAVQLPDWPRLMAAPLAAAYLGIGESTLRASGPAPKRLGRRALWDRRELDKWADALGYEDGANPSLAAEELQPSEQELEAGAISQRVINRLNGQA